VIEDGDLIEIDIPNRELNVLVSTEEISTRLSKWSPPGNKIRKGYLAIYSKLAKPAEQGAGLSYGDDKSG
jgi:dihydroxy-acid dehydratase